MLRIDYEGGKGSLLMDEGCHSELLQIKWLKTTEVSSSLSTGGQKSKVKLLTGHAPSGGSWSSLVCGSVSLIPASICLHVACSHLCLCFCVQISLPFLL